jgi:hypothetical protein
MLDNTTSALVNNSLMEKPIGGEIKLGYCPLLLVPTMDGAHGTGHSGTAGKRSS